MSSEDGLQSRRSTEVGSGKAAVKLNGAAVHVVVPTVVHQGRRDLSDGFPVPRHLQGDIDCFLRGLLPLSCL